MAHSTLGSLLAAAGDHAAAASCEAAALEIREALGDSHGSLDSLMNLATVYRNLGDAEQALGFQTRALAIQRRLYGEADPATSRSRLDVAYTLLRLGRQVEAARLVEEGLRHDPKHVELRQMQQQVAGAPAPGFRAQA